MAAYAERAREIALALSGVDAMTVTPLPPHANAFQVHLRGDARTVEMGALEIAGARGVWLFNWLAASPIPGHCMGEIQVGDAAERLPTGEIVGLLRRLLA
jgi:hypothetical protein